MKTNEHVSVVGLMREPTIWTEMRRRGYSLFHSIDGNWYVMCNGRFCTEPLVCATVEDAVRAFRKFAEQELQKATA